MMHLFHTRGEKEGHRVLVGQALHLDDGTGCEVRSFRFPDSVYPNGQVMLARGGAEFWDDPTEWGASFQDALPWE